MVRMALRKCGEEMDRGNMGLNKDLNYEMRMPRYGFWFSIFGAAFSFTLSVIACVNDFKGSGFGMFFYAGIALLATLSIVITLKWKITVKNDLLIIHRPFRPVREIKIVDISAVKQKTHGIVGYAGGKEVFAVGNYVSGFDLFYAQLYEAGKMEK